MKYFIEMRKLLILSSTLQQIRTQYLLGPIWELNHLKRDFNRTNVSRSVISDSLLPHGPSGFSVHGILQARIQEWVAIFFSRGSSQPKDQTRVSCIAGIFFTSEPPGKDQGTTSGFCQ